MKFTLIITVDNPQKDKNPAYVENLLPYYR
jgi:hypothetical protein